MKTVDQLQTPIPWYLLYYQLLVGKLTPNKLWKSSKFRFKFALRTLVFPKTTINYLQKLSKLTEFRRILKMQGILPAKPHRPYLCKNFNVAQRAQALLDHYLFLSNLQNSPLQQSMLSNEAKLLATLHGKNDATLYLYCRTGFFDREGEVTLILHYNHIPIALLSFSIIDWHGSKTIFIGGLQGPRKGVSNETIREATKSCFGLFPKRILLEAICHFAVPLSVTQIVAVEEKTHVFSRLRYRHSKVDLFLASYSEFWTSIGGVRKEDGLFYLPLSMERKPLEQVVSKKRSEYRRRYQFLDDLDQQLKALSL